LNSFKPQRSWWVSSIDNKILFVLIATIISSEINKITYLNSITVVSSFGHLPENNLIMKHLQITSRGIVFIDLR